VPPEDSSRAPCAPCAAPVNARLRVPEQLGLDQAVAEHRAVDRHEDRPAGEALLVERVVDQLLAGAGFALDHHRSGRFRKDLLCRLGVIARARAGRRPARRPLLEGHRGCGRPPRDPGAGDGQGACGALLAGQPPRAAENVLANLTGPGPRYGPIVPDAPVVRLPANGRRGAAADAGRNPRGPRTRDGARLPGGATEASPAQPAHWASPARASRS